jgi:hypothetical protein
MLKEPVRSFITAVLQLFLKGRADVIHVFVQEFYNVEHVNTHGDIRKASVCKGNEATVHVAAKEFYFLALLKAEREEIRLQIVECDMGKDVNHASGITVCDVAVVFDDIPAVFGRIPEACRTVKFIDTQGFRKSLRNTEAHGIQYGGHDRLGYMVSESDAVQRADAGEIPADIKIEAGGDVERGMKPW